MSKLPRYLLLPWGSEWNVIPFFLLVFPDISLIPLLFFSSPFWFWILDFLLEGVFFFIFLVSGAQLCWSFWSLMEFLFCFFLVGSWCFDFLVCSFCLLSKYFCSLLGVDDVWFCCVIFFLFVMYFCFFWDELIWWSFFWFLLGWRWWFH